MLKQPFSGVLRAPPSPVLGSRRASYFSSSSSSLLPNDLDMFSEDVFIQHGDADDDNISVSSLESFASGCSDDDVPAPPPSSRKLKAVAKLPGSYFEKSSRNSPQKEPLTAKVTAQPTIEHKTCYVQTPPSKPRRKISGSESIRKSPLSPPISPKSLACPFDDSSSDFVENLPYALAVATPISAIRVEHCCDRCDGKNLQLQKQAQEIEQLKGLVTQLVTVLGKSLAENQKPQHHSIPPEALASPTAPSEKSSASREKTQSAYELSHQVTSTTESWCQPSPVPLNEKDDAQHHHISKPIDMPAGTSRTMLRLCHLKQLKDESSPTGKKHPHPHRSGKRHLHVCVAGNWGYYSGPPLEQNTCLHGCVVRFDNGDLYLGDMMCYIPSTSFFSDDHGLQFHGRGTLYRTDGTVTRGLFHKHHFKE